MINKILALDLGSNSIGATIRNLSEEDQFDKTTVITFETGVGKDKENKYTISLAANRTDKRGIRRLYQARKYKLWAVLEALIKDKSYSYCPISEQGLERWKHYNKGEAEKGNGGRQYPIDDVLFANWIKLDFNNDGVPDYISPYQLRNELATRKLDFSVEATRFKLGRALYHIAQHRGFKSSKILQNKDEDKDVQVNLDADIIIGAEKPKQEKFKKEIERLGFAYNPEADTVGMIFAQIETEGIHDEERKTEGIRIRKNLHQYVTRKMLIKEVKHIFEFQELDYKSIFNEDYSKSAIFWQRPLRSQKGLVGLCTLESHFEKIKDKEGNIKIKEVGKKRCPISRPEFEEFRALSLINSIKYRIKGIEDADPQFLPQEMRIALYNDKFFVQKDFEFSVIHKWITTKNGHNNWELNYNFKTNVSACVVSARLQKIFGEQWNNSIPKKENNGKEYTAPFYEDIWHVLFESDDEDFIEEYGRTTLKFADEDKIKKLCSLWYAMPTGYAQLSLKAINNILPFLREGFIYTDAALLGKIPDMIGEKLWNENKDYIKESLKTVIENNRKEKRILNIVNSLIIEQKFRHKNKTSLRNNYLNENQIIKAAVDGFGKETWTKELSDGERTTAIKTITDKYRKYVSNYKHEFYKLPRLGDEMKKFLAGKFSDLLYCPNTFEMANETEDNCACYKCKLLNKLYHPSLIAIYPEAREEFYKYGSIQKQMVMLGSPKTGAFKNPMAMRTLYELKKLVNYYIATGQIDQDTRVVVEVGRELVDTNKRWAYDKYDEIRRQENKEFADAIRELLNDPKAHGFLANADSDSDIDKFRLWYDMMETPEGFEKGGNFIITENDKYSIEKKKKGKSINNEKTEEQEEYYEFSENHYEKIKKEVWSKLKKAAENVKERYKLWKDQECRCIYTGNVIKITDLFQENLIDVEHTIPRSISFDDSLANKTVCYADFNRNIKKNRIPYELNNYQEIERRIEKWQQKVKDLEMRVEFWKGKSKSASTPEYKNNAIRQKHLWQFELDYWENKVERFTMKEVRAGFKNSQLKDTQLISKYAFHYLKSYFSKVDVQKGAVTAQFRKILNIQEIGTEKDRTKHSHHAKDAVVLSVIPPAAIRDRILEVFYKLHEEKQLLHSDTEKDKASIAAEIRGLEEELEQLKFQCNLPRRLNNTIHKLDEELLINNIARNRSLIPANKKVRFNGKSFTAKGDAIRGQLHKDSFLGAIRLVKKDDNGKWIKNKEGEYEFEPIKYVTREELIYKNNTMSPGFKDLDDLGNQIVDKDLFNKIIKPQVLAAGGDFKEALSRGIWMLDKNGTRVNKIRRVRIVLSVKEPKEIKRQSHINEKPSRILPDRKHKQLFYAENGRGANIICAFYQSIKNKKGKDFFDRELEIISLKDVADLARTNQIRTINELVIYRKDKTGNPLIDEQGNKEKPYALLQPGMKVVFYEKELIELYDLNKIELNKRIYTIIKFSGTRITFGFHLDARPDGEIKIVANKIGVQSYANGYSKVNFKDPAPRYLLSKDSMNMAIEGKHFKVKPDGEIIFNK